MSASTEARTSRPEDVGSATLGTRTSPSARTSASPPAPRPLPLAALLDALSVRDLTDPRQGAHALQILIDDASAAMRTLWDAELHIERSRPIVTLEDNYDRLGYAADAVSRDVRYTRYVSETTMLRSHTSAGIPPALRRLAAAARRPAREHGPEAAPILLVLPGICHRRDTIDRIHTGTPHQMDIWLLRRCGRRLDHDDLHEMVSALVSTMLPGVHWRWTAAEHPYTTGGRQVDAIQHGEAVEIAECGLAAPHVLAGAGLDPAEWDGLALGMGLDRMLMLRKGIPDIRLLRSADPRVSAQMTDLEPYRPVSDLPPAVRDISIAVDSDTDVEILGDRIREDLGNDAELVEDINVVSATNYDDLPQSARDRLGIRPGQVNFLVRITIRPTDRTLTSDEANTLRDRIHAALHPDIRG
ncbi:hypothetical protein [Phytoactinopolyspora mesophila]|uniref:FDX-ACB domain-containing protein n=1 Tax=Phytoactinopolyspora mesophila TaxID=2650750 RepID=A0A7K3M5X1_9ACTN|nr:hypothetical protein [Phytoactinopolyspora mesophila]NDL58721.1 hypothetical protein [Phytoactinopolyspora mesophila]